MNTKRTTFATLILLLLLLTGPVFGAGPEAAKMVSDKTGSELIKEFSEALYKRDHIRMSHVVEKNMAIVSMEANALCDAALAPGVPDEEREAVFYVLERLATAYRNATGDQSLLEGLKKRMFESRLSPATASSKAGDFYVVESIAKGASQVSLSPDNIIIKSGETVRWVNRNTVAQQLASVMSPMGRKEILSPVIEPGKGWEHTFYVPGEYYYITLPNKVLYGKVVVTE